MINKKQVKLLQIKAFTMLESLLVLGLVSILGLGLSGSVQSSFSAVEEQIFFMEFEELYRETQNRSLVSQQKTSLNLDGQTISNGSQSWQFLKEFRHHQDTALFLIELGVIPPLLRLNFRPAKERFAINYI